MKAFYIEQYGKQTAPKLGNLPTPKVGADDVLVKIQAASINPLDLRIKDGELKMILPYKLPLILGNDFAGTVVEVGERVEQFQVGDEVYARTDEDRIGAFAEYIAISEAALALKPKSISMNEAAALPLVALTAWQAFVDIAQLKPGQKVLIHAGSGGVGSIAIQLAKHLGAYVATTTSASNAAWVKALGADEVIDYKTTAFEDVLHNYDVVFDTQGGKTLDNSLKVLKAGGTLVSVSGPPDAAFAKTLLVNGLVKCIIPLLSYSLRRKAKKLGIDYHFLFMKPNGQQLKDIAALVDTQKIVPVIDQVFPFDEIQAALAYVEAGRSKGKVVVSVG